MPVTKIKSRWDSGNLIFHESTSLATIADVLTIGTTGVTVGSATNDINFSWLGTTTGTFDLDAGAHTLVTTGLDWTITGDIDLTGDLTVDVGDIQIGDDDFLMFGDGTGGDIKIEWDTSGTGFLSILPLVDNTLIGIGNGTLNCDLQIFGGTANYYIDFDADEETGGTWNFGQDQYGIDVKFFGATTGHYLQWDQSADDLILYGSGSRIVVESTVNSTTGATGSIQTDGGLGVALNTFLAGNLTVGATGVGTNFSVYSDVATVGVFWVHDADTNSGAWSFGVSGGSKGTDVYFYGDANTNYWLWDSDADDMIQYGTAGQLILNSTVNSTTTGSGSIHTLGGLGVALNSFFGGTLNVGTITAIDAAGPAIANEPATTTNPTLIPNKADLTTGIGWNTAEIHFVVSGVDEVNLSATALSPGVTDSTALGTTALMWSDLFLADVGVINWNSGDTTLTATGNLLTLGASGLSIGADGAGFDVIFYGDRTGSDFWWDQNGESNVGSLNLGTTTVSEGADLFVHGDTAGNYLHWDCSADDLLLVGTDTQFAIAGDTDASSTTTGSLRTAGGLGVVKKAHFGDNVTVTKVITGSNVGAVNTGVTAVEYGDGYQHVTVLTVSQVDALTTVDNGAGADGYLLYTFPAGVVVIDYAYMTMGMTATPEQQADTPDVGLGTVIASGGVALLDGTGTFEDIITGQTALADGTAEVITLIPTASAPFIIQTGDAHTIHFNVADTWADDTSADLTADIAGTVVIAWRFLA